MEPTTDEGSGAQGRVGRPKRGTEAARADYLIATATRVILRDGYGAASIDKVASEAGVSTRTIYERYRNKADLLVAVINRLMERDMAAVLAPFELDRLEPRQALLLIGQAVTGRACNADSAALFRIVATEAHRFPELAKKMRGSAKVRVNDAVASYFCGQNRRGTLTLKDPERASLLFMQMLCADLHERLLFGSEDLAALDWSAHVNHVIDIFLNGAIPRSARHPDSPPHDPIR